MAGLDGAFASHMALTLAHILPALAFVLIAPLVVFRTFEKVRWAESFVYPLGVVVGLTAYAMSTFAVGGWVERSAVLVFDTLFLFSLLRSYPVHARGGCGVETAMAVAGDCGAAWDRDHASGDGRLFCYKCEDAFASGSVFRHRVLDWVLNQCADFRSLDSYKGSTVS